MNKSLNEARTELRQQLKAGEITNCPCCAQIVKAYRRKIDKSIARSLAFLVHRWEKFGMPIHYKDLEHPFDNEITFALESTITHWNTIRYWGLAFHVTRADPLYRRIEYMLKGDPDKPNSGYWVPTPDGQAFVRGHLSIRKYKWTYNGRSLKTSGPDMFISDCIGEKFSWSELTGERSHD